MFRLILTVLLCALSLWGAEKHCPAYPQPQLPPDLSRTQREQAAQAYAVHLGAKTEDRKAAVPSDNLIDVHLFGKMAADGVEAAPLTTDGEFLRRVMLDLTGRIPTPEQVDNFLNDQSLDKRTRLVDSLIGSEAFVDYWTFFYANFFEVPGRYYNLIGIPGRNLFYRYLRDFVENDRSYRDVATELITATGDSYSVGPPNFAVRAFQQGDPIQDTWDTQTDRVTTRFLGIKTECISCHDGRRHLEEINLYLTSRRRSEFMRLSAFFSRMDLAFFPVDAFNQQNRTIVTDRLVGSYHGVVNPNNPGPRPPRSGGPYEPVYLFTGERPRNGEWRREFARMLVADRQFARVAVNYVWAHFFRVGIVDPPDGWDLSRIDPKNPPAAPWTLQPSHPELIEALADEFIRSNYKIRRIIRLIVESTAYQLSSRYVGEWRPEYARYFAKHFPRRLKAEEVYDAVTTATMTETPMFVAGFNNPVFYATQLPDPTEPIQDGGIRNFLTNFGRGDWWQIPRSSSSTVIQVLYMMNDAMVNVRTFGARGLTTRVAMLMNSTASDDEAVRHLYLATLGRNPTEEEMAIVNGRKTSNREQWLSDVQWTLVNKLDFLFNY